APEIKSIKIANAAKPIENANPLAEAKPAAPSAQDSRFQTISWEAADPNGDELIYSLYFRAGSQSPWILLKDKLKETNFEWDTRLVADGRYEIKVVASDEPANAIGTGRTTSRVSDPIPVDNTPPVIGNLTASPGATDVRIKCDVQDHTSTLA